MVFLSSNGIQNSVRARAVFYIHIFKEPHTEKKKHGVLETNTDGPQLMMVEVYQRSRSIQ